MRVGAKLQVRPGSSVAVLGARDGLDLELPDGTTRAEDPARADAVIAFVVDAAALDSVAEPAIRAARDDRLAWIAYPKAGQLGTDLDRDVLARLVTARGARPVRQVALDGVWSALRFRPV